MKKLFLFFIVILSSCATVMNRTTVSLPAKKTKCAVLPFVNYTETPLAGLSASSLTYGVLASKSFNVVRYWNFQDRGYTQKEINEIKSKAEANGFTCIIGGYVNEWCYKTGIDGEPAVSLTIYIKDGNRTDVTTVSGIGWAHESIGTLAQKLLNKAF